ncbi:piggyBac transposable element-derived protein 4-like [Homalodisca vitripennis]|uniref:piggyBac transposable element-derived protein 4-like n=1 Tax=Homalodisca vitripennis TaxID=197043 RepID=UPI001EEC5FB1|nr:piggyBac transposable element-derived protein 4-like [Homalodisca vitripennis]
MAASTSRQNNDTANSSDSESDISEDSDYDLSGDESDNLDEDNDHLNPSWSPFTQGLRRIPFTAENRFKVPVPGNNKPIDWFTLVLDDIFLENIVRESNIYAFEVYGKPNLGEHSRINKWQDLTVPELKVFIGLLLHMGTIRLNRYQDYWKTSRLFDIKCFRDQMSRDRFLLILRCLHFSRNVEGEGKDDRLKKISMLVSYFNQKMDDLYYPCRELSLDEGMVLWRGRLLFRQYIKGKRHKYGVKLYSLCEPQGLVIRFAVYSGGEGELGGKGHASKVVMHLMRGKLGVGHSLYMDNYYNSVALASKLLANKTYCTGTLRLDRKHVPADVKTAKLQVGETIQRYAEGVMVAKWRDKRIVSYLSTEHENNIVQISNRRNVQREKPMAIVQYNANMKGVDRSDQMLAYYPSDHKCVRWYKKIFIHLLQMIMVNAHKLYNVANDTNTMQLYDFRLQVIDALLPPKQQAPPVRPPRNPLHVLSKTTALDKKGRLLGKRCRQCLKEGRRKETVYMCAQCPGEPPLCALGCYDKYHAQLQE